jgi:glycosyltransferase involved in cell wall biosynthesis/tetratricopeptide (TPR) repeat protein
MYKRAFGAQRQQLLTWLTSTWFQDGPPICVVEGFPGVGKTALAGDVCDAAKNMSGKQVCFEQVTDRPSPSLADLFIDLAGNLSSHCNQPDMETILLAEGDLNLARALDRALRNNVLIVIDDAQRLFKPDTGEPTDEFESILIWVSGRRGHQGRLLLLSDRLLDQGRWSTEMVVKRLPALESGEAIELLEDRLAEAKIPEAVPQERKADLVHALGWNPRAIETLVSSLAFESLDEVIGRHPGFWSVEDRSVSRSFLQKLETDLLERSVSRLSPDYYKRLLLLSVHRKNFESAVFQVLSDGKRTEGRALAHALVTHFLVNHAAGWYSVQPLVREIGLVHLKDHDADFKLAHARAADYYLRPLISRDGNGFTSRLVNSFAEARYHLFHAGRNDELKQLLIEMIDLARTEINATAPVPVHPDILNERIGILSILLESEAPGGLHYYMARCLRARKGPADLSRAIEHARIATSGRRVPADSWVLLAQLLDSSGDKAGAVKTVYKALDSVPAQDKRFALYHYGATLLANENKIGDALILLQEGILNVPVEKSLAPLYVKAAELYVEQGRQEMAIGLLRDGTQRIGAKQNLVSLYRLLVQLLVKDGNVDEAAEVLRAAESKHTFEGSELEAFKEVQASCLRKNTEQEARQTTSDARPVLTSGVTLGESQPALDVPAESVGSNKRILVLATEWLATRGGLSTFNRELCIALAREGHEVVCVVPQIAQGEVEAARNANVSLIAARPTVGDSVSGLMRKLPINDFNPDLVIGHGRITGQAARAQKEDHYPNAKRIHFIHMAPAEIEWYKDKDDAAQMADQREKMELDLSKDADLVAAVGPRLHLEIGNLLSGLQVAPRLHLFIPGLRGIEERHPSPGNFCLVLGRSEDLELKGLDIAALAMARLLDSDVQFESTPELVVRGAPQGTGTRLREQLRKHVYPSDLSIRVKEYSADVDAIEQDLRRASVLLMPSRREGFGLVALEALQAGTPILVSNKSGFADFLKTKITDASQLQQYVVRTVDDCEESAVEWCKALEFVLRDRKAAFRRTADLKEILADYSWQSAAAALVAAALDTTVSQ